MRGYCHKEEGTSDASLNQRVRPLCCGQEVEDLAKHVDARPLEDLEVSNEEWEVKQGLEDVDGIR